MAQELINSLIAQALVTHEQPIYHSEHNPAIVSANRKQYFDPKKFAELIVQECFAKLSPYMDDQFITDIESELNQHFGIAVGPALDTAGSATSRERGVVT